jgi:hypothetical protein
LLRLVAICRESNYLHELNLGGAGIHGETKPINLQHKYDGKIFFYYIYYSKIEFRPRHYGGGNTGHELGVTPFLWLVMGLNNLTKIVFLFFCEKIDGVGKNV